jgi:cell shape-determining protein MreC
VKRIIFTVVAIGLGGLLLFIGGGLSVAERSSASAGVSSVIKTSNTFFAHLFARVKTDEDFSRLREENSRLKAELLTLQEEPGRKESAGKHSVVARVFSTYPFNNHGLLTVNAGLLEGIQKGMPVLVSDTIFLGQVVEVTNGLSVVRTIFDPDWQLSAKAGNDSVDGLLIGGRKPRLTMIQKDAAFASGDSIYSAGRDFPFGLFIGEAERVEPAADTNFKEASLAFPYTLDNLTEVSILTQ